MQHRAADLDLVPTPYKRQRQMFEQQFFLQNDGSSRRRTRCAQTVVDQVVVVVGVKER